MFNSKKLNIEIVLFKIVTSFSIDENFAEN